MKNQSFLRSFALPLLCGSLLPLGAGAHAATTISAFGGITEGYSWGGYLFNGFSESSESLWLVEGSSTGTVAYEWDGGTMVLEGEAHSRTRLINGMWQQQVYASATLTDPHRFAEGEDISRYVDGEFVGVDGEGDVPSIFGASATSRFITNVQYGGTAIGYNAGLTFRVHGFVNNDNPLGNSYAGIGVQAYNVGQPFSWTSHQLANGEFDYYFTLDRVPVASGIQTLDLSFHASVQIDVTNHFPIEGDTAFGQVWSGVADFYHTLELVGIDVRDENGNVVWDAEVFAEDGYRIPVVDATLLIPEPSAAVLVLLSGVALGRRRSRRI